MGNKNSGRPSAKMEAVRTEVRGEVINMSWQTVRDFLRDPQYTLLEKVDVASKIAVKSMPSVVAGDESRPLPLTIVSFADAVKPVSD